MTKSFLLITYPKQTENQWKKCERNLRYFSESVEVLHITSHPKNIHRNHLVPVQQLQITKRPVPSQHPTKKNKLRRIHLIQRMNTIQIVQSMIKNWIDQSIKLLIQRWIQAWKIETHLISNQKKSFSFLTTM